MRKPGRSAAILCLSIALVCLGLGQATLVAAGPTTLEKAQLKSAEAWLGEAGTLFSAGKFAEAGKLVERVQRVLDRLGQSKSAGLAALVEPLRKRADRARELLTAKGIKFSERTKAETPAAPAAATPSTDAKSTPEKLEVVPTGGSDAVLFARDLGPLLVEHCLDCHGDQNPGNGLSMFTFARLLAGGNRGVPWSPGKPAESLIVKKLRGQADGQRMPRGKPPLPEEVIARFEKWIELGAKFDGEDSTAPLEDTVALVASTNSTHDELAKSRADLAAKNWQLVLPDTKAAVVESPQVLVYGSVDRQQLEQVARVADEQAAAIARLFKLSAGGPLVKGRLTLYVFDKRYDYAEVGTMLERRELPADWRGHWRYTGVDAYGCLLLMSDEVPAGLIAQQLAGAYVAGTGKVPRWFSEGTARAVAARLDPRDERVKDWEATAARLLQTLDKPQGFLDGKLPPEEADVLSYGFVKSLLAPASRFNGLLEALAQGIAFETAFEKSFRAGPTETAADWIARGGRRGR
jgi:hypothetical protein